MDTRSGRTLGEPDFVILTENRSVLLVECKARNRKRSTEQRSVEVWARKLKHIVWLVFAFDDFMAICEMTAHWRDPKHDYSLPAAQREAGK
jgi:Holliday junction resolvase-like predicted endonuclease